jgi:hypothetical protein
MGWSNRNYNFFCMRIWLVINFEFLDLSWLFPVHRCYHRFSEEFCGCNKQVLFVFCDGYCLSTSTVCVGYINPEICELILTRTFTEAIHKKNSKHVNITPHSECKFLLSGTFVKK